LAHFKNPRSIAAPIASRQATKMTSKELAAKKVENDLESRPDDLGLNQLLPGPALENAVLTNGGKEISLDDQKTVEAAVANKTLAFAAGVDDVGGVSDLLSFESVKIRLFVDSETEKLYRGDKRFARQISEGRLFFSIVDQPLITGLNKTRVLHVSRFVSDIIEKLDAKERTGLIVCVRSDVSLDNPKALERLENTGLQMILLNLINSAITMIPNNIGIGNLLEAAKRVAINA
jgi:hypothetical protein